MHRVVVLALPDTIAFDLATPIEVLGRTLDRAGRRAYEVTVAGSASALEMGPLRVVVDRDLEAVADADTVVIPGRNDPTATVPREVLEVLLEAAAAGTRLVSICVGAFTLAATGLLDGRRATTHWRAADAFRACHPAVRLDPGVLYVDEGRVLTSAGATAGVDLCLYLVERDLGAAAAAEAARVAVSPVHREGGQAQYISRRLEPTAGPLEPLLAWMAENSDRELVLRDLADRAGLSERTLHRRFRDQLGVSPTRWLTRTRIEQAREMLEATDVPVERIGRSVGFRSPSTFRALFADAHGVSPRVYRRTFQRPP